MTGLNVFDLDGTLAVNPEFYRQVYSGTLEKLIRERKGEEGLAVLEHCRRHYDGKGELALLALNIPFIHWARLLNDAPVELLSPRPDLCELVRSRNKVNVIYTGSPVKMTMRILTRLGFDPSTDFGLIVGWQEPELFPLKWTCSPLPFEGFLKRFAVPATNAWAIGDVWDTDLMPAKAIGMKTAMVRKPGGDPDVRTASVEEFLRFIKQEEGS